jgi:hypothetical protein
MTDTSSGHPADGAEALRPPRRHWLDTVGWIAAFGIAASGNAVTRLMEAQREGEALAAWIPWASEWSSALASLAVLPAVLWFLGRWPLHADTWRRRWPAYLAASVVWSLLHVIGMVVLRKLVHAAMGGHYDFGDWPRELFYEYLKDVRTFALVVWVVHGYRWYRRRRQGEALLLDAPDEGPSLEPVERPRRFLVRKLGREFLVAVDDIEWMQASGNYVNLHVRGHDYPLRSTIGGIESKLDPSRFVRIHRSYIANLDRIASIEPLESGDARIHLKDASTLPCSRRYRDALKAR